MQESLLISVIIPLKKLSYSLLFEALPSFQKQTFKEFEVIILPNNSEQYDLTLVKTYKPWLRIIPTGKITRPAEKRNLGVKNAKGEIIAFIDDDAFPKNNWLKQAIKLLNEKNIEAVCGPGILPIRANDWEKIFDEILKTWIGSGGYSYRFKMEKERFVDDYPSMNFFINKKIFNKLGGFKGNYWPGEDSKLCEKLVYKEKGHILYSPKIVTFHHRRKDLKGFLQQHANYGFHRGAFFSHGDRNSRRFSYLIPTFFIFYLFILILIFILFSTLQPQIPPSIIYLLTSPLFFYLFAELYLFIKSFVNTNSFLIATGAVCVMFLTHLTYGIMFIKGLIVGLIKKDKIYT